MVLPAKQCFSARRAEFCAVRNFVESACAGLPHADRQRLVLIVEELFANSIEHGYQGDSDSPAWVTLAPTADGCQLVYEDTAPAHDPFASSPELKLEKSAPHRPVGGLGVFLIGQLCTLKRHERRGEHNVIELFVPRTDSVAPRKTP
ncbi:MAG: ATP-binding protein [Betaproteobacteria bacterium]